MRPTRELRHQAAQSLAQSTEEETVCRWPQRSYSGQWAVGRSIETLNLRVCHSGTRAQEEEHRRRRMESWSQLIHQWDAAVSRPESHTHTHIHDRCPRARERTTKWLLISSSSHSDSVSVCNPYRHAHQCLLLSPPFVLLPLHSDGTVMIGASAQQERAHTHHTHLSFHLLRLTFSSPFLFGCQKGPLCTPKSPIFPVSYLCAYPCRSSPNVYHCIPLLFHLFMRSCIMLV